jgi:DAACS family dicarboxylate/amino acid:cation (Na+ or H+) symporter
MAIGFARACCSAHRPLRAGADAPWVQWLTTWVTQPAATLFLRLIFMLVIPLLFSALVVGVAEMGDVRSLGRIGWRTLAYTVVVSAIAVVLGLVLVNSVQARGGRGPRAGATAAQPGQRTRPGHRQQHDHPAQGPRHVPVDRARQRDQGAAENTILAVMFFALMLGIGLVLTRSENASILKRGIEGLFEVSMTLIGLVIRLAPYAVFCMMFNLAALFGWDLMAKLGAYVGVVVLALAIHMFVGVLGGAEVHRRLFADPLLPRRAGSDGHGVLDRLQQRDPADCAARRRRTAGPAAARSRASSDRGRHREPERHGPLRRA